MTADITPTTAPSWVAASPAELMALAGRLLLITWAIGALLVLARLALGMRRVRRVVREAQLVTDPRWTQLVTTVARRLGVQRQVTLYRGPAGTVPVTCGIVKPIVMVPTDADEWDQDRRTVVLTHELAHVRRLDVLTHLVGQVALSVFWFHPLAWIATARMRLERERACDDLVLAAGVRPSRYAGDLLDLIQTLGETTVPAVAALAMARKTEIEGRLVAILDSAIRRGPLDTRRSAMTVLAAGIAVVALASVHPVASAATVRPPASAPTVWLPMTTATLDVSAIMKAATDKRLIHPARKEIVLADIANAAATMASDAAKRQVLLEIAQRYCASDTLRKAIFSTVRTMSSDGERRRVLLGMLGRVQRDLPTVRDVIESAQDMNSDADKSMVLRTVAGLNPLSDPDIRMAFYMATSTIASSASRTAVVLAVLGEVRARDEGKGTDPGIARYTMAAVNHMSESDKVRVLHELAQGGWLTTPALEQAFKSSLATISGGVGI